MSLSALCCRSSPHLAMSLPSLLGALPRCGSSCRSASAAVTQMEAAIGWLQRNAGLSGEGRVSLPEVDSCSVTAAQRLSGDCGATSAFPAWLEARRVPAGASPSTGSSGYWTVKTPRRQWRQPLTAATTRIWCCTPSKMLTGAQETRARNTRKQSTSFIGRQFMQGSRATKSGRTAGLTRVFSLRLRNQASSPPGLAKTMTDHPTPTHPTVTAAALPPFGFLGVQAATPKPGTSRRASPMAAASPDPDSGIHRCRVPPEPLPEHRCPLFRSWLLVPYVGGGSSSAFRSDISWVQEIWLCPGPPSEFRGCAEHLMTFHKEKTRAIFKRAPEVAHDAGAFLGRPSVGGRVCQLRRVLVRSAVVVSVCFVSFVSCGWLGWGAWGGSAPRVGFFPITLRLVSPNGSAFVVFCHSHFFERLHRGSNT